MAVPLWPELAWCGASMARPRTTAMAFCSTSSATLGTLLGSGPGAPPAAIDGTRHRRGEAVEVVAPAHRPELAGAEHARHGVGAEQRRRPRAASWSGSPKRAAPRPLQVNSRAPSASVAVEQAAQVLVGRRRRRAPGTARWRPPRPRRRRPPRRPPGRHRARCGSGSRPAAKSSFDSSITMPAVQALAGQRPARRAAERVDHLHAAAPGRGPAAQLVDHVALGPGDDERLADGPAALRHHRASAR